MSLIVSLLFWCMPSKEHLYNIAQLFIVIEFLFVIICMVMGYYLIFLSLIILGLIAFINQKVYNYYFEEDDGE